MSSNYSVATAFSANTVSQIFALIGGNIGVNVVSFRFFGEATSATASRPAISRGVNGTTGSTAAALFNSRSAANSFGYNTSSGGFADESLAGGLASFSHGSWIPSPRWYPILNDRGGTSDLLVASFDTSTAWDCNITASEPQGSPRFNRLSRRTSKPGYFQSFGQDGITNHQKTGSGSFQIFAPHFDNDVTWVDTSAWENGSSQSETWNINLFAPPSASLAWTKA